METRRSPWERFLSVFAPVQAGEGGSVLLLTLNVFLLLTAYYIIKPVREALILSEWGAEAKIYTSAGQAALLLLVVPLYSRLAGAVDRRRLISYVLFFFMGCLGVFYLLAQLGVPLGIPFYLWVGIFNVMVIAQFWSFANDIYTSEQGKRLFAIVGFGASSGAVLGGLVTVWLIEPVGVFQLLLLSAGLLGGSLLLTWVVDKAAEDKAAQDAAAEDTSAQEKTEKARPEPKPSGRSGFSLVFANRYLLLIAVMMVLANLVNTTGEYILGSRVKAAAEASVPPIEAGLHGEAAASAEAARLALVRVETGKFYSSFFNVVNVVGLLMQLFLVSRIVRWVGVRWAILVLPVVAFGGYILMGLFPLLAVTRWVKTAENSTDYSLQNTVRNMLFLPTTREEKYQAKQAIDSFFWRAGDMLAGLLVLVGTTTLQLSTRGFASVNVVLAAVWIVVAVAIGRRFRTLTS